MNRYQMRKQFGRHPDLAAVLVWSLQHALKAIGTHPDGKRQRKSRKRDLTIFRSRELKQLERNGNYIPNSKPPRSNS
jgi:hypothetical protein